MDIAFLFAIFMLNIIYFNMICFVLQRMSLKAIAFHLVEITYISRVFNKKYQASIVHIVK